MPDKFDPEKTIDAVWCVDSESGKRYLIERATGKVIVSGDQLSAQRLEGGLK